MEDMIISLIDYAVVLVMPRNHVIAAFSATAVARGPCATNRIMRPDCKKRRCACDTPKFRKELLAQIIRGKMMKYRDGNRVIDGLIAVRKC